MVAKVKGFYSMPQKRSALGDKRRSQQETDMSWGML